MINTERLIPNLKQFALIGLPRYILYALILLFLPTIYLKIMGLRIIYWFGYYWWEGRHDSTTIYMMQCYTSIIAGKGKELENYRYDWHDFDMFEKAETLIMHSIATFFFTADWVFTLLALGFDIAYRYLLHESLMSYFRGLPLWHIGSGNTLDDWLRERGWGPLGISLWFIAPSLIMLATIGLYLGIIL